MRMRGVRAAAVAAALVAGVAACGGGGDAAPKKPEETGPDEKTVALIEKTNKVMKSSSFTASGSNSAFGGAEQEITWDPDHGFHRTVRADDGTESDMYCRDGRSYVSSLLLAESLSRGAKQVTVPEEISDAYVTVQGKKCGAYFHVPTSAERAPDRDATIDGRKSRAVTVGRSGSADTFHIAATGKPRLLKQDAERDGTKTTMTYGGYGEEYEITLPEDDRLISMSDFQKAVMGAATSAG